MVTRASRAENQGAMNAGIVNMLVAPKTAHAGVQEIHFLPFNPTSRRPTLAEFDSNDKVHRIMLVSANSNWTYPWDHLMTKSGLLVQMIVLLMKNITELIMPTDIL
ncbi:plasma membrane ATPase 2-like isoform X2 [Silene latifolia]|uniref:plasma membrane ATPase 2-like isoform X2 n=1 Tax=Silene latifolia TaxID=37657 RepID=UPI003D787AEA